MIFRLAMTSIRHKVMLLILGVTLFALFVAGVAMTFSDWNRYREYLTSQLNTSAEIISRVSVPAMAFDDRKAAHENLAVLAGTPAIKAAALYTAKGELFASYLATGVEAELPKLPESDGMRQSGDSLVLFKRIVDKREILGTLYLEMRNDQGEHLLSSLGILTAVTLVSMLAAYAVSAWLQRSVTEPVLSVVRVARHVIDQRDFSMRAEVKSRDETGLLVEAFNRMLDEIGRRSIKLVESNRQLEREILDRRSVQGALQASERRSRALVEAIAAVTWVADSKGNWLWEVPAWQTLTGQQIAEYEGVGWHRAFHEEDQALLSRVWGQAIADAHTFEIELRLWHAGKQEYRFVSLRVVPTLDELGGVAEWIGSISDIHDRRMAEEAVRVLNAELEKRVALRTEQLEEANRELESFSYSVSHDLRSPLRAVSGFSKILAQDHSGQLDGEGHRLLGIIQSEAARMGSLIDDLLAFSRLGRKALQPVMLDMAALIAPVLESLKAGHVGAEPEVMIGSLPPAMADRSLLLQVWSNLLSNAFKFSSKVDKPVVEIGAISEDTEHIYFVRDNGAGFDPRFKAKLFGVFQRLHDLSEFTGTGVGLALVQRIVTRHGGRVWADGAPGKGATFYFTLPRDTDHGIN